MVENIDTLTPEKFHKILHKDIDKPVLDYRKKWSPSRNRHIRVQTGAHKVSWAEAMIFIKANVISVQVYLNFKQNSVSDSEYKNLIFLARSGISQYWSRHIHIDGNLYLVRVQAYNRAVNAIPVDLYVEGNPKHYARSMNPAILGIDASFIYNKGRLGNIRKSDADFMLVAAHEFGHSVLMYAGGLPLSWGHKGSTNPITQSIKSSTPGYPKNGSIDLMKYYDPNKSSDFFNRRIRDSIAMEIDIKRLIWEANIKWIK